MSKKTKLLEAILEELQAIRAFNEQLHAPPATYASNFTITTSGFGGGGGNWNPESGDPGLDRLAELVNNPEGEEAKYVEELPETEIPEGKSFTQLIEETFDKHGQDLLRKLKAQ